MSDKELKKLRELADWVKCGHRACKELVRAVKRLTKRKETTDA